MPTPVIHPFPIRRPGFIAQASWIGPNDDLALQPVYYDSAGILRTITLRTRTTDYAGEICLPTSNDVADMGPRVRDILAAHVRMAMMLRGFAIPGSVEFEQVLTEQSQTSNFQTAVGAVKCTDVIFINDQIVELEFQKGSGPKRKYQFDYGELQNYSFAPSTQLFIIAGAVEKQFPTYNHDFTAGVFLTESQKQDIVDYVLTLSPWM